ncbi:MAG: hypothetical protein AABZ30_02940 [Myxococcota bacterium]
MVAFDDAEMAKVLRGAKNKSGRRDQFFQFGFDTTEKPEKIIFTRGRQTRP